MDLVPVQVSAWDVFSVSSRPFPIVGGRKYRTFTDAIGFEGTPCSAYFIVIMLDKDGKELGRVIRWLNDLSGNVTRYPLVFRAAADATRAILGYRINCESALKGDWFGRLRDLRRVRLRKAREGTRECHDDISDLLRLNRAVDEHLGSTGENAYCVDVTQGELHPLFLHMDFSADEIETIKAVRPFTMTSNERIYALIRAVHYLIDNDIPGDIVECGVWKGGSMMAAAKILLQKKALRDLYLFDTFAGCVEPTEKDAGLADRRAIDDYHRFKVGTDGSDLCFATLEEVTTNLLSTGYPAERMHFVKGRVEDTLPGQAPETISLLRLDTDWYESTRHEMAHLFPRLSKYGILFVDDYGYWQGSKEAVDEYVAAHDLTLFLSRVDYTGRIAVKV